MLKDNRIYCDRCGVEFQTNWCANYDYCDKCKPIQGRKAEYYQSRNWLNRMILGMEWENRKPSRESKKRLADLKAQLAKLNADYDAWYQENCQLEIQKQEESDLEESWFEFLNPIESDRDY